MRETQREYAYTKSIDHNTDDIDESDRGKGLPGLALQHAFLMPQRFLADLMPPNFF